MKQNQFKTPTSKYFEIQKVEISDKNRHSDSPTSSILKIPTPIFVTTRSSSTKRLKFANGPVDLQTLKNGSHKSESCLDESLDNFENIRSLISNGESVSDNSVVEVAISPVKKMQVSPETWKAFLEYKKYHDYSNETEKTDYTYSRLSKFRHKEIIPGFLIRPNLCRTSISSRRSSSTFIPSTQTPLKESYSYEFKVHSQPRTEDGFDFKTPNFDNKAVRSKYYLRSSSYGDGSVGEIEGKPLYFEREYFSNSAPETFFKASHSSSIGSEGGSLFSNKMETTDLLDEGGSRYSGKMKSMDLDERGSRFSTKLRSIDQDDIDIDEVDDNIVRKRQWCSDEWARKKPQTVSQHFSNFFSTMFLYITSFGTLMSDQISRHILRRKNEFDHSSYMASRKNLGYPYAANAGAGRAFSSWSNESPYYYSGDYYGSQRKWYQNIYYYFYDKFLGIANLVRGSSPRYSSYKYDETSRKRKYWWLLIPLLLLAGFWLLKAEQQHGFISDQYEALNYSLNGFFTPFENAIRQTWRWVYMAYKRMSATASCYVNDSWERLKLPFVGISELLGSRFSVLSETWLGFAMNFLNKLWEGSANLLKLFLEAFSNLLWFLLGFLNDFLSAIINVLNHFFAYLFNGLIEDFGWVGENIWKSFRNVFSSLGLLFFAPRSSVKVQPSGESCKIQQSSVDSLKSDMMKSLTWDLDAIRKKIDELEIAIKGQKQLMESRNELYDKQLDDNLKALQKYQDMVNYALISAKKPGDINHSRMQYFLNNQAEGLKQWITQNFILKSDSSIDEDKIGLYIAQYSNKTGEELLALKNEFNTFVMNHKHELESLKKEYSHMATTDLGQSDISLAFIKKLVQDAIKLYDADKTGKVDYALETAGGQVISIRCSETYLGSPVSYTLLGWSVYSKSSSPRDAISPGMAPGQCWAFAGSQGYLVLQLSHTIQVTGFTMEHVSKSLVPKGHFESAPKNFSMWGLQNVQDPEPYLFGEYMYLDNDETVQYFQVIYPTTKQYNIVELRITSNYGNLNYTCLYRIRVHGDVIPIQSKTKT